MKKFNKGNQTWYSHKTDTGWCGAKMEYTLGKLQDERGGIVRQITACVPSSQAVATPGKGGGEEGMD